MSDPILNYNAEQQQQITTRREELTRLIELVSMQPHIKMKVGPPHSNWSFNFAHAVVSAPVNDLLEESDDYCRGLALHEAAHATVTRIFDILHPSVSQRQEYHSLFNVIEDCRIETWIMERSPGAVPWIQEYNNKLFTPILNQSQQNTLSAQYLGAVLSRWWFSDIPAGLDDRVVQAIEDTGASLDRAIAAQPPRHVVTSDAYERLYKQSRSLTVAYLKSDLIAEPSPFECLVRLRQLQMVVAVIEGVVPTYERLLELDRDEGRGGQLSSELKQLLADLNGHHLNESSGLQREGSTAEARRGQSAASQESSEGESGGEDASADTSSSQGGLSSQGATSNRSDRELQSAINQALSYDPNDLYLNTWNELYREIDYLSESLLEILSARSKPKWLRRLSSGTRIDLREAMAFEADPRKYETLWMKQKRPEKIDPAFIIHIDISGSMDGERIRESFKGLVLLTEVCARLNIPLEIISFNNRAKLVRAWDEKIEEEQRETIAKLLKQVDNSTYYAEAINLTLERLPQLPFRDRFLIALSDGEPHDPKEVERGIEQLSQRGVYCIGLGIGPDTSELRRFFNEGLYEVTPTEVAEELALLMDRLLR